MVPRHRPAPGRSGGRARNRDGCHLAAAGRGEEDGGVPTLRRASSAPLAWLLRLCWAVVGALWVVSAFHLAHREPWNIMVGFIAVTPWIYMLAWATAAVGLLDRRYALAGLSLVLVAMQVWWVAPDFNPFSHLVKPHAGQPVLCILDANVSQDNFDLAPFAAEIRAYRPDVVAMEEITKPGYASLMATGALKAYRRHSLVYLPDGGSYGMALWSRYRLSDLHLWHAYGHPEIRAWVHLPGRARLRLDVVHTNAPYGSGEPGPWAAQMEAIRRELSQEPRPLLVVGDLNASWYDWHFQAILHLGLRDAAVEAGKGWEMTFPANQLPVWPYVRIDHVLYSGGLGLVSYGVVHAPGSAHRGLVASVTAGA